MSGLLRSSVDVGPTPEARTPHPSPLAPPAAAAQAAQAGPPPPGHPPFSYPIRVYWEDTDAGGVVFYANYLKFFERARTEWLRALGLEQQRLRDATGAIFVVSETAVRYLRPARLDDLLEVDVRVVQAGRAQMTLAQQARRGAESLAEGTIRIACIDAGTFRPCRIPISIVDAIAPLA